LISLLFLLLVVHGGLVFIQVKGRAGEGGREKGREEKRREERPRRQFCTWGKPPKPRERETPERRRDGGFVVLVHTGEITTTEEEEKEEEKENIATQMA
jgi:hypothetical protein